MDLLNKLGKTHNHNIARVLFKRNKEQIKTALQNGFSRRVIFDALSEDPNFNLSYSTFTRWVLNEWTPEELSTDSNLESVARFKFA